MNLFDLNGVLFTVYFVSFTVTHFRKIKKILILKIPKSNLGKTLYYTAQIRFGCFGLGSGGLYITGRIAVWFNLLSQMFVTNVTLDHLRIINEGTD